MLFSVVPLEFAQFSLFFTLGVSAQVMARLLLTWTTFKAASRDELFAPPKLPSDCDFVHCYAATNTRVFCWESFNQSNDLRYLLSFPTQKPLPVIHWSRARLCTPCTKSKRYT